MNKTFGYRKQVKIAQYILMILFMLVSFFLFIISIMYYPEVLPFAIFMLGYTLAIFLFIRRIATIKVTLLDEGIHYKNVKRDILIKYSDIISVSSKSINYTGGYLVIQHGLGKPIRLTVVIKEVGELVYLLKNKLDELGLKHLYDEDKLFGFYKTASYSDQSWERAYYFFPRFIPTLIATVIVQSYIGIEDYRTVMFLGLFISIIPYLYIELGIYARQIKNYTKVDDWILPEIDRFLERKRMQYAYLLFLAINVVNILISFYIF